MTDIIGRTALPACPNFLPGRYDSGDAIIRTNFDGRMADFTIVDERRGYLQVYRSEITEESIHGSLTTRMGTILNISTLIPSREQYSKVSAGDSRYWQEIGVTSPIMLHVSLLRVDGMVLKSRIAKQLVGREYTSPVNVPFRIRPIETISF